VPFFHKRDALRRAAGAADNSYPVWRSLQLAKRSGLGKVGKGYTSCCRLRTLLTPIGDQRLKHDEFLRSLLELADAAQAIKKSTEQVLALQATLLSLTRENASSLAKSIQPRNVGLLRGGGPEGTVYPSMLNPLFVVEGDTYGTSVSRGHGSEHFSYVEALPVQVNRASLQQLEDQLAKAVELLRQQAKLSQAVIELTVSPDIKLAK
jgi:hypothetical protein